MLGQSPWYWWRGVEEPLHKTVSKYRLTGWIPHPEKALSSAQLSESPRLFGGEKRAHEWLSFCAEEHHEVERRLLTIYLNVPVCFHSLSLSPFLTCAPDLFAAAVCLYHKSPFFQTLLCQTPTLIRGFLHCCGSFLFFFRWVGRAAVFPSQSRSDVYIRNFSSSFSLSSAASPLLPLRQTHLCALNASSLFGLPGRLLPS